MPRAPEWLQQWYDDYPRALTSYPDMERFVYAYFTKNGYSEEDASFAVNVMIGERGDPSLGMVGDNGESLGPWQLRDSNAPGGGLRGDFINWANSVGANPDPFDPISTTAYVEQFTRKTNGQGWSNWSVANQLMAQGAGPGGPGGGDGRTQFASEQANQMADTALIGEQIVSERHDRKLAELGLGVTLQELDEARRQGASDRAKAKLELAQETQRLSDARKEVAIKALIDAAPFYAREGQFKPGFEPSGAASSLGAMLGTSVPSQVLPTQKLPLNAMVNAPEGASYSAINAGMDPYQGETPAVPGLREALLSGMGGLGVGGAPTFSGTTTTAGGGGGSTGFGGPTTYEPARSALIGGLFGQPKPPKPPRKTFGGGLF